MTKDERREKVAREFLHKHYPSCLGYPKCDGDLPGESHEDGCLAKDRKPKKPAELLAEFAALAVEEERVLWERYAQHDRSCIGDMHPTSCDCGLTELRARGTMKAVTNG